MIKITSDTIMIFLRQEPSDEDSPFFNENCYHVTSLEYRISVACEPSARDLLRWLQDYIDIAVLNHEKNLMHRLFTLLLNDQQSIIPLLQ